MRIPRWMLAQEAQIRPYLGSSAYENIYGDPFTVRCRLEFGNALVRDRDGNEVVSSGTLFLEPMDVSVLSTVIYGGVEYDIVDVQPQPGPRGQIHHVEVRLK